MCGIEVYQEHNLIGRDILSSISGTNPYSVSYPIANLNKTHPVGFDTSNYTNNYYAASTYKSYSTTSTQLVFTFKANLTISRIILEGCQDPDCGDESQGWTIVVYKDAVSHY